MCVCGKHECKLLCVKSACVCVQLESVEAELSCSGPGPDGIEQRDERGR